MSAWVTREWIDDGGNRRRERSDSGLRDVREVDRYVVEWLAPDGKRHREKIDGAGKYAKRLADERCRQLSSQILLGTYEDKTKKVWDEFRSHYQKKILDGMKDSSRDCAENALAHYERLINPKVVASITSETIDEYVSKRRREKGRNKNSKVSAASVNKELRHLRAVFRRAERWGYMKRAPFITFLREDEKLPLFVTPEHFAAIYSACEVARVPSKPGYEPADWWRALLVMAYMTGWRISELMTFRRSDLDLEKGEAFLKAQNTKGRRDERIPLHPLVLEHLQRLKGFTREVFDWPGDKTLLYDVFAKIQTKAGVKLECSDNHEHTDACHRYGFHDLRRAFATMNAERMTPDALQALMRHRSYQTTQRYVNYARQLTKAVAGLYAPVLTTSETA